MIKYSEYSVFDVNADAIVNKVDCDGQLIKGLALEFALRYPSLEEQFLLDCKQNKVTVGKTYLYEIDGQKIINFPVRTHFQAPISLDWIERGLRHFCLIYKSLNIKSIAFPYLGDSLGVINEKDVLDLIYKYLYVDDLDVYICSYNLIGGKEKEMLDKFRYYDLYILQEECNLNKSQLNVLLKHQYTINRFSDILSLPKIGLVSYKAIYYYFYYEKDNDRISLF